jgi:hypothetical protein
MESVRLGPKVIPLSGAHCICKSAGGHIAQLVLYNCAFVLTKETIHSGIVVVSAAAVLVVVT